MPVGTSCVSNPHQLLGAGWLPLSLLGLRGLFSFPGSQGLITVNEGAVGGGSLESPACPTLFYPQPESQRREFAEKLETLLRRAYHLQEEFGSTFPSDSMLLDLGECGPGQGCGGRFRGGALGGARTSLGLPQRIRRTRIPRAQDLFRSFAQMMKPRARESLAGVPGPMPSGASPGAGASAPPLMASRGLPLEPSPAGTGRRGGSWR